MSYEFSLYFLGLYLFAGFINSVCGEEGGEIIFQLLLANRNATYFYIFILCPAPWLTSFILKICSQML